MDLLTILVLTLISPHHAQIEESKQAICEGHYEAAIQQLSDIEGDLKARQLRADAHFILHQHEEAIADYSFVLDHVTGASVDEKRMQLRCFATRHLCYSFLGNETLAAADLESVKPLLQDPDLQADFPDYIEGLRLLVSHEESQSKTDGDGSEG